jgi:arabinofuranosyltransferase
MVRETPLKIRQGRDARQQLNAMMERHAATFAWALGACLVALAWTNRFVQDDAFISFRYARNLADGLGLVWNPGARVEGYTNFLWTLVVAAGLKLGAEPVAFTQALGLVLFACALALAWRLALESGMDAAGSLAALLVTGANFTFSSYATGGLETPLVTALFLAGLLLAVRAMSGTISRPAALLGLSIVWTAGVTTRMDSAILLAGPVIAAFTGGGRHAAGTPRRPSPADLARLGALPVIAVGAWLLWKHSYYGDLLPRAFYLKAVNAGSLERGLRYFYEFIVSYDLAPFFFFCLFCFGAIFRKGNRAQLLMAAAVTLWSAYVLKVGGDFMEYRFLAPVVPPMMLLLVWMLVECTPGRWIAGAGIALLLAGSFHHAATFSYDQETGVEPIAMLEGHLYAPGENWVGIGKALDDAFDPSDSVVIATTAAGAIPYYSGLRSVDMLGLNEPPERRPGGMDGIEEPDGVLVGSIPGHQRVLTYEYLNRRGVHLVISHPIVTREGDPAPPLPLLPTSGPPHLTAKLITMPIGGGYRVQMLYIRPNPAIDAAIAGRGWETRPIVY